MSKFTTRTGEEFELLLTVADLRRVRELARVDLGAAMKDEHALMEVVFGSPESLVEVLYVLCQEQCEKRSITPENFARGFDGPTLEKSTEALLLAVADFFQRGRVARAIKENLPALLEKMEDVVIAEIQRRTSKASAGGSPPSPG